MLGCSSFSVRCVNANGLFMRRSSMAAALERKGGAVVQATTAVAGCFAVKPVSLHSSPLVINGSGPVCLLKSETFFTLSV